MASKTTSDGPPEQSSSTRRGTRKKEAPTSKEKKDSKRKLAEMMGDASRGVRLRAGLTQADVAERVGVATEVYGRLERGLLLPSVPTLRKLCLSLHVAADTLLALDTAHPPMWAEDTLPLEREKPQLRRLMNYARKLTPVQLRVVSMVAATLVRGT